MCQKIRAIVGVSVLFLSLCVFSTYAQDTAPTEKQKLVKKLLEVTQATKMAENTTDLLLAQMQSNYSQMLSQVMPENMKNKNQEQLQKDMIESNIRFSKRFRELYPQRVNFQQLIEQIYYPLYDKFFTDKELNDLIAFYQSPTGQKSLSVMPQLLQEAMQKSNELLNPKISQLVNELLQEEKEFLSKKK